MECSNRKIKITTPPAHYDFPIQPLVFILRNNLGFCEGNIIKYVCRYKRKGGVDDLQKARDYLDELISREKSSVPT